MTEHKKSKKAAEKKHESHKPVKHKKKKSSTGYIIAIVVLLVVLLLLITCKKDAYKEVELEDKDAETSKPGEMVLGTPEFVSYCPEADSIGYAPPCRWDGSTMNVPIKRSGSTTLKGFWIKVVLADDSEKFYKLEETIEAGKTKTIKLDMSKYLGKNVILYPMNAEGKACDNHKLIVTDINCR